MSIPYVRGPTRGQKRAIEAAGGVPDAPTYNVSVRVCDSTMYVEGDTYELRDKMRAGGGEWNAYRKNWGFASPVSPAILELLKLDAPPLEKDGEIIIAIPVPYDKKHDTPPLLCSNGKTLVVSKSYKPKSACHTCNGPLASNCLILGMHRIKTISRGAGYFGDGSAAWSKQVDWTDWSHLDCLAVPKTMYRELVEKYQALGGWELGVDGVTKLNAEERQLLSEVCMTLEERITKLHACLKENCPKLPVTLTVLITEYVYPMDPDRRAELGAAGPTPAVDFSKFTVAQLKTELKSQNLDTTGTKGVLLRRLLAA